MKGITTGKILTEIDSASVRSVIQVNLLSSFWTLSQFLPAIIDRNDGCVVTISSLMGLMGSAYLGPYCASKWGLLGLDEVLRMELRLLGKKGVHVVSVCPFAANTGMFKGIFQAKECSTGVINRLRQFFFPLLTPSKVAESILEAILIGRHQLVVLPHFINFLSPVLHLLPIPIYDKILELAGGVYGMSSWVGKE